MAAATDQEIKNALRQLYVDDPRPWLVGFSGGKDSTMLASLTDEQAQIAARLGGVRQLIEAKHTKIAALQRLKKSLMQNLLTGRIRLPVAKEGKP